MNQTLPPEKETLDWQVAQDAAIRTEPSDLQYQEAHQRLGSLHMMRTLHAAIGLSTEVGELQDALKKYIFYGKRLDGVNIQEEAGDITWYLRILADTFNDWHKGKCSFEEMVKTNIEKLKKRFPDKFNEEKALNRDLAGERMILDSTGRPLSGEDKAVSGTDMNWPESAGESLSL